MTAHSPATWSGAFRSLSMISGRGSRYMCGGKQSWATCLRPRSGLSGREHPTHGRRGGRIPKPRAYYFVGKDNIPFHAIYWPALIMGHGGLNLPTDVPANQYVTFGGAKASKSRGVGQPLGWYLDRFEP